LKPANVEEIRVHIGKMQRLMLRNTDPRTGLEAKFSMEFAMAAALVAGRVGLSELTDAFVARRDVRETLAKVRCTTTDDLLPGDEPFAPADHVSVRLTSGVEIAHEPVSHAKGSWQKPLDREELAVKFLDCATRHLDRIQAIALFDQLWQLDQLPSIRQLRLTGQVTNA
jgi:2-methylcitrate dehydratase PrpD